MEWYETDMDMDLEERISTLARWIVQARYPVFFTGAGISTESGLPDYRGPDGVWTRRDKGLPPKGMDVPWNQVEPNEGHKALVELQNLGRLKFLISQNIDNLHLKSGIRPELIAELHGNMELLVCRRCGTVEHASSGKTGCPCGGKLVSSIVDFGMALPEKELRLAFEHSRLSDLFVVVGSSLVVQPASLMPEEALEAGARLVIINQGETPYDGAADLLFREPIGMVLPPVVREVRLLLA